MKTTRKILLYLTIVVSVLLILLSLLSLIYDLRYWYSKVLDFPRTQYLILSLLFLFIFLLLKKKWNFSSVALTLGLAATIIIQASFVLPYLAGDKPVPDASPSIIKEENLAGIMIANVLISNRQADTFLEIVQNTNPDLLLVMEVNQWWIDQLQPLKESYAYRVEYPTDNAYGMALYSKFPLQDVQVKFLKHQDVPSIHASVVMPSGKQFRFHGVHPVAPVPSGKYPDNEGLEEVALGKVGEMVAREAKPALVAGDFNDVSWSNTSRLFEEKGNLRNVRLGRGLFNSFSAQSLIMRWPLDHYFVTVGFGLVSLQRLPKFGSDHFPMYARLALVD